MSRTFRRSAAFGSTRILAFPPRTKWKPKPSIVMTEAGTTFDLSRLTFSFSRCSTTAVTEPSTL